MKALAVDTDYLIQILLNLLNIPSPSGYSDQIVHFVGEKQQRLEIEFDVTRRGAIQATLEGPGDKPHRAVAAHLDTLGAMVHGFICARHLDDKAGAALLLAVARPVRNAGLQLPVTCHFMFTIFEEVGSGFEEVGSGASSILYGGPSREAINIKT